MQLNQSMFIMHTFRTGVLNTVNSKKLIQIVMFFSKRSLKIIHGCGVVTVPKRSCGKVMFSQASFILSTGGEMYTPREDTPPLGRHPLGQTPL